ncbi:MAG: alpha/beta hydrolase fold protein [Rhodospirillales bacterium]|jgi:pimeloyl-ACP methyl ester carboxylesterase|nr:alpha/beta hydrolase fold protein [Rhodospirillales bacterium]
MVKIAGIEIELYEGGAGAPLLFLHSAQGFDASHEFVGLLAKDRRVIAPSHPGFGKSGLPDWVDSIDDLAHVYLELMGHLRLDRVDIVGCSVGGWIAADLATKIPERLRKLVLVAPVGVKTGPSDKLDIPDIFALPQEAVAKLLFHDPAKGRVDFASMSDEQLQIIVRNRESLALLAWEPYMHNPKLVHRLHRATMPTLFLRGASDGIVSAPYLERYAALLPNATISTIAAAGHAPQIEQPAEFTKTVLAFLDA